MVSQNVKMEAPSLPTGNPEKPRGSAAEGATVKIRIALVANSYVLVARGSNSPTKFPNPFGRQKTTYQQTRQTIQD